MNSQGHKEKLFDNYLRKKIESIIIFSHDKSMLNAHCIERLINFKVNFDYIEARFNNRKINRYGVYFIKKEIWQECFVQV